MPSATLTVGIRDGKGKKATMTFRSEILDDSDLSGGKTYESMADNILQDLRPVIDGEIMWANWTIPVGLDAEAIQTADPDCDVEEGALFQFETAEGFPVKVRIPTFKESLLIAGSSLVNLANGAVQDFINTIIDGPDSIAGVGEDRINMTDNRGADITKLRIAKEAFKRTRKFLGY